VQSSVELIRASKEAPRMGVMHHSMPELKCDAKKQGFCMGRLAI